MNKPSKFTALLENTSAPILSDGAMGTVLNARGATFDQCFDALNLSQPALVGEIHRAYIDAGSQMIQTNTFGANRYKLAAHGLENKVKEINRAGVELAPGGDGLFSRSADRRGCRSLGVRLAPFGQVQPEQARQVFAEQISALAEAGADLLILETFSDLLELREAVAAARGLRLAGDCLDDLYAMTAPF